LVSTRILFGAAAIILVIIGLVSVVLVQQMTIQRISGQTRYVTQYVTEAISVTNFATQYQPVTITLTQSLHTSITSQSQPIGPYVLITYSSHTANSLYVSATGLTYVPHVAGDVYLILTVNIQNNGYSVVYLSLSDLYVTIQDHQYSYADYITSNYNWLPSGGVFNGLSVTGNLVYEVPPNYGTFALFWNHPPDINVIYSGSNPTT